jgi:thioredoxin reductase
MAEGFDVIIVGDGPAGIFAALELVGGGHSRILILEKGKSLAERNCVSKEKRISCVKHTAIKSYIR